MLKMIKKVHETAVIAKAVLKSAEFDQALDSAVNDLNALEITRRKEYMDFKRLIKKQKDMMDKYYTGQRKTICKAFFAQLKSIYAMKEKERAFEKQKPYVVTVFD